MCQYIKDNGDQCGRDTDPFCFQHEDTEQAENYEEQKEGSVTVAEGVSQGSLSSGDSETRHEATHGAVSASSDEDDPYPSEHICDACGAPVRRVVSVVKEATYQPKMASVEEAFACECGHHVIRAQNVPKSKVPDGWT
jgi:hypothetical protein